MLLELATQFATEPEWFNRTTLHPIGVMGLLLLGAATFMVPREYTLIPMLILACCIASAQRIVVATLDLDFLRLMILFGWTRIVLFGEARRLTWKALDVAIVLWSLSSTLIAMLLHHSMAASVNRAGHLYDALGLYFLCRQAVRNWDDVRRLALCIAVISLPVAIAFLIERLTGRNMFSIFGGVHEFTTVREGRLRCRGPFPHPILAGAFWVSLMPIIGALWWQRRWCRPLAIIGLTSSLVVVITCASSTPLMGLILGGAVAALLPLRRQARWIRLAAIAILGALHLLMEKPVWHLIARIDVVAGSTGWYRYRLIDDFINHFGDWWLIGTTSRGTWWNAGGYAITNEYVLQGIDGGLLSLVLFIAILVSAFGSVGRLRRRAELQCRLRPVEHGARRQQYLGRRPVRARVVMSWALGTSVFMHAVMFTGVTYFGQTILVWYLTLGIIGSMAPVGRRRRRARYLAPVRPRGPDAAHPYLASTPTRSSAEYGDLDARSPLPRSRC